MGYAPCAWEETVGEDISLLYMDITWAELEPGDGKYDWEKIRLYIFKCNLIFFANYWTK